MHEIPRNTTYTCTQYPTLQQWVPRHYWWCRLYQLHYPHDIQSVRTENRTHLSSIIMCAVAWVPKCIPPHTMVNNIPVRLRKCNFVVLLWVQKSQVKKFIQTAKFNTGQLRILYTDLLQYVHMHCTYLITPTLRVPFSGGVSRIHDGPKMLRWGLNKTLHAWIEHYKIIVGNMCMQICEVFVIIISWFDYL